MSGVLKKNQRTNQRISLTSGKGRASIRRSDIGFRHVARGRGASAETLPLTRPGPQAAAARAELEPEPEKKQDENLELMETSDLRESDGAENVSEINLSKILDVQEHEEVDLAKTEAELAAMSDNPECGLSNVCHEMELMLGGGPSSTSTPNVTLSGSSLPSLVSMSSRGCATDSGHDSGTPLTSSSSAPGDSTPDRGIEPSPVFSPITPRVTEDFEIGKYVYFTILNDYCHRISQNHKHQERLQASAGGKMPRDEHLLKLETNIMIMILSTLFIHVFNLIYSRNLIHVTEFPWANRLADHCNYITLRLGNKAN